MTTTTNPVPTTLRAWSLRVSDISASKGFKLATWETFPTKLMLIVTEVQEAIDATDEPKSADNFAMELADIAIRILESLDSIWRAHWSEGRVLRRPSVSGGLTWRDASVVFKPVMKMLVASCEAWRKDDRMDAMIALELALLQTFRVADATGIDLMNAIATKCAINEQRPMLHGKAKADA